jgi:hypothetical protein
VSADYDSPWKEALDFYFEAFLALLFPAVHAQIDWSRGYESLDTTITGSRGLSMPIDMPEKIACRRTSARP